MSLNVEVLEQSFERVKPYTAVFASSFYDNLFNDYPQVQILFANTDMKEQEKKLIYSLVLVVENLRNPGYLTTVLQHLGERHVRYGTIREHYPLVGAALLKTFESYLGQDWTPEVKQAWIDAYGTIVDIMLEGAKYPEEILKLENAIQQGAKSTENATVPTPDPTTTSSLNYAQKTSELKNVVESSPKPVVTGKALSQSNTTTSRLNLKLIVIAFAVASLIGAGLLYYYSSQQQDNRQDSSIQEY